ncbi:MAG: prolipoprotein diacylglyceryl transferase [Kangiellaceae bacterium]|nr:prolipoprotein diacylglyceryl transferase [Kangiellaceae bacterium]
MEFPNIDPVIFQIYGPIGLNWYGLTYLAGFAGAWWLGTSRSKLPNSPFTAEQVSDFLFYAFIGVILGGRIGYVLFYHFDFFLQDPIYLFKIYDGGMSFHGGLLGVLASFWYFARKTGRSFGVISDFFAPMGPIGLATGRIGNFINGELWGKPTDVESVPWAMIFPAAPGGLESGVYRHPSQLYEFALEGLVLFLILYFFSKKPKPVGSISGLFLIGYGSFRFIVEYFREPDDHLREMAEYMSMGQLLSLPMIIIGLVVVIWAYKSKPEKQK